MWPDTDLRSKQCSCVGGTSRKKTKLHQRNFQVSNFLLRLQMREHLFGEEKELFMSRARDSMNHSVRLSVGLTVDQSVRNA